MPKPLTFLDSNVLFGAWRGNFHYSVRALSLMWDPKREYISSPFVRLETDGQAAYHRRKSKLQFYETHFSLVRVWVDQYAQMVKRALEVGERFGVTGMDALHIAATLIAGADEFITAERPTSPFSRVKGLTVRSIY